MTTHDHQRIELPAPCTGPMLCAFGITLGFAGIVTSWPVAVVGVIFALAGGVHWWRQVLPDPVEITPDITVHPTPIEPRPERVAKLTTHRAHRARVPLEIHPYSAGITGGLIGGLVMAAVALTGSWLEHGSIWFAINVMAGTAMPSIGDMSTEGLLAYDASAMMTAGTMQLVLCLFIGLLYGVIMPLLPRWPVVWGTLIIPAVWCGLMLAAMSVVNPALETHIDWTWFIGAQVAFGLVCSVWVVRAEKIDTMQHWSYLERLGMEAPGVQPEEDDE
ncbi:MAG: hypothetical protein MK074_05885 [Phycisphaerales bacterium]|nr:hypothetical protein [Phycisphaerales bacterium]